MSSIIFCDESGYTGQDLLSIEQPFFVYVGIKIQESLAKQIYKKAVSSGYQGSELKSKNLLKYSKGRKIAKQIIEEIGGNTRFCFHNKEYALCCTFFEQLIEPCLHDMNSVFYPKNMHRFVASFLYMNYKARHSNTPHILKMYQDFIRQPTPSLLEKIILSLREGDDVMQMISLLLARHKYNILKSVSGKDTTIDLTQTSVGSVIRSFYANETDLQILCDKATALKGKEFNAHLHNITNEYLQLCGFETCEDNPFDDNVKLEDSKNFVGIQLADVVSGSIAYALQHKDDFSSFVHRQLIETSSFISEGSIRFDKDFLDLQIKENSVNLFVFETLCRDEATSWSSLSYYKKLYEIAEKTFSI